MVNGMSQPITFASDANTLILALRSRKAGDSAVTSKRAHKITLRILDPSFVEWLNYGKRH